MDYKGTIYQFYRSSFKGEANEDSLRFGASKLRPVLEPWVADLDRAGLAVDLGCGAGELLWALGDLGFQNLAGCDLSEEQVAIAVGKFPGVVAGDLFTYLQSFPDASLQLITVFDVIEHLAPQQTFDLMALAHAKLRSGGRFIAHLPNGLSPFVGHVFWGDMTHEWCLTPQSAQTLCALHSFEAFAAVEHLGAGSGVKGRLRALAWSGVRTCLQLINAIETGNTGGGIWTRNFAFKADKSNR